MCAFRKCLDTQLPPSGIPTSSQWDTIRIEDKAFQYNEVDVDTSESQDEEGDQEDESNSFHYSDYNSEPEEN